MAQFTIEAVTIAAVATICAILAAYLLALKKSGWLGSGSKFYRCPSQECKRIFQKPIELTDLSVTPTRVYPACPHCGIDLEPILGSDLEKKLAPRLTTIVQHKKTEIKTGNHALHIQNAKPETVVPAINPHTLKDLPRGVDINSQIANKNPDKLDGIAVAIKEPLKSEEKQNAILKDSQQSILQDQPVTEKTATSDSKSAFSECPAPKGCHHFFGYLRNLPKTSATPDSCYSCPIMVDCCAIDRASIDESLRALARVIESEKGKQLLT